MKIAILVAALLTSGVGDTRDGSICIPALPAHMEPGVAPGLSCESAKFSLKIDGQPVMSWSHEVDRKITDLSLNQSHRVAVYCDGKPQQSFSFKFGAYKSKQVCLFLEGFYGTVQLQDESRSPWCKCK